MKLMKCCSPNGLSVVLIVTFELFGCPRNSNMRDGVHLWQQVIPLRIGKAHANVAITAYIKYCLLPSFIFLLFFFFCRDGGGGYVFDWILRVCAHGCCLEFCSAGAGQGNQSSICMWYVFFWISKKATACTFKHI